MVNINNNNDAIKSPRVLAITGGKGGVGKTSIAVNLAIALSRNGSRVCLFDADTALGNINIMLGLHPLYTLEHLFSGEKSIQDILIEGPERVHIVPGASGAAQCVELDVSQQQRLVSAFRSLDSHYDYMLVDTAAGISPTVLHFVAASQVAAVVVTPEPTSLTDAFSLLKAMRRRGYKRRVQVIVNMAPSSLQAEKVYRRFSGAVAKYLDLTTEYLGSVWMDESMRTAVTLQKPVALFPKNDPSARSFYRLAERVDGVFARPGTPKLAFSAYWSKVAERQLAKAKRVIEAEIAASTSEQSSPQKVTALTSHQPNEATNVSVPQVVEETQSLSTKPISVYKQPTVDALPAKEQENKPVIIEGSASFPVLKTSEDKDSPRVDQGRSDRQDDAKDASYEDRILELAEQANQADSDDLGSIVKSIDEGLGINSKVEEQLSQVETQLRDRRKRMELAEQLASLSDSARADSADEADSVLEERSEKDWVDLRVRLNRFFSDPKTTPEQATTLLSSCIYNYGDRLGEAAADLLHGLMSTLKPEDLSAEQKLLLKNDYERLALNNGLPMTQPVDVSSLLKEQDNLSDQQAGKAEDDAEIRVEDSSVSDVVDGEPQNVTRKVKYDAEGFGSQESLAEQIRSNPELPLENFLESIKFASMAGSSSDES